MRQPPRPLPIGRSATLNIFQAPWYSVGRTSPRLTERVTSRPYQPPQHVTRSLPLLLIAVCALSGCDGLFCDDCGRSVPSLFEDDLTAEATPDRAVYDRPIAVRATVTPRFSGTGAFALGHIAGGRTAEVVSPTAWTLGSGSGPHVHRVEFDAGVPETVEWTIQLGPRNGYVDGHGLPISAFADSVEVGDSLLPVESTEVQEALGEVVTEVTHWPRLILKQ